MAARQKKKKSAVKIILLVLLALIIVGAGVGIYMVTHVLNGIERIDTNNEVFIPSDFADFLESEDGELEDSDPYTASEPVFVEPDLNNADIRLVTDPDVTNVLLIGCDSRTASYRGRSDSMIILSVNSKTNSIAMVSILRDTYVEIPGYANNKLNASYAFGGITLLNKTIEHNFGIHIDYNVCANFQGFVEAMTQVGSLTINLSKAEADHLNKRHGWNLVEGNNVLSPTKLLAYSRIRHMAGNDWGRTERQRKVIMAAFNKYKKQGLSSVLELIGKVTPYVRTDMTNSQIVSMATKVVTSDMNIGSSHSLPSGGMYRATYVKRKAVLVPDLAKMSTALHQYLYGVD